MEQKISLKDCTKEESDLFMKEFGQLLEKHSLYFEPVPQFERDDLKSPWKVVCQVFLQKKVEVVEKESLKSPLSDEITKKNNESTKED